MASDLVVLEEEGEVLVADVHLSVAAHSPVLLHRVLAPGEGVLVHLNTVWLTLKLHVNDHQKVHPIKSPTNVR